MRRRPGDPLFKEGMPVPEPRMINSDNASPPKERWVQTNIKLTNFNFIFYSHAIENVLKLSCE